MSVVRHLVTSAMVSLDLGALPNDLLGQDVVQQRPDGRDVSGGCLDG